MGPAISVIIATANGGALLPRSIASVERQTETSFQVMVVSDGSTDGTPGIVRKMQATRPWLTLIELTANIGPGLARDRGIRASQGEFIAILDDDDEWIDPGKLSIQRDFLESHADYVLVGAADTDFAREDGTLLFTYRPHAEDRRIRRSILLGSQFVTSSVMFRRDVYQGAGGFAPMHLAEDYDLWMRMMKFGNVANLKNCRTRYYARATGAHKSNIRAMNHTVIRLVKQYRHDFPHFWPAIAHAYLRLVFNRMC